MKKVVILILAVLICLCACGKADKSDDGAVTISSLDIGISEDIPLEIKTVTDGSYPGDGQENAANGYGVAGTYVYSGGAYYADSTVNGASRVAFMDFESLYSFPMCARPNCAHDDPEACKRSIGYPCSLR